MTTLSNLSDFEGVWQFVPPHEAQNEYGFRAFDLFNSARRLTLFYNSDSSTFLIGPNFIGFDPEKRPIIRLSDLQEEGHYLYFYEPNPEAPNDSIKYFRQASPSCVALYNGIAGEGELAPPENGEPNYFTFNFNGRENEYHVQIDHLPNYIITALDDKKEDREMVEDFLNKTYGVIQSPKVSIYSSPNELSPMYLIKGDPVEIVEERDGWLKIKYYPEKDGQWTGETIEGWIRKEDVE